jgi:hypothetical protein
MVVAADGDSEALYELGVAYVAGVCGTKIDYIEAHKWFILAALNGNGRAQESHAEVADYMTAREIAEARR